MNEIVKLVPDNAPPVALAAHTQTANTLIKRRVGRTMRNCMSTVQLMPQLAQADTLDELLQMQSAVMRRLQQQNQAWIEGCAALVHDYTQIKQANTMTKLLEQQFNLFANFGQLMNAQITGLVGLQENIEVDFGYWAHQKLNP
jgi:hypothetical protein